MRELTAMAIALLPIVATAGSISFSEPTLVVSGPPSAIRLTVSPDGSHQLYGQPRREEEGGLQIVERRRTADGWSEPEDVPFNTEWNDFDPAFALDGSGVWFFSNRPGGEGGDDLWFVPLARGVWGEPVNPGRPLNTERDEWAPTPLADGALLFSSDGHGGLGGQDLFIAERTAEGWRDPVNLGPPVNSPAHDYDAAFLGAGALMLSRSDAPERGAALYYSCRGEDGYGEPRPAGPNVNLGGGWGLGPSVSQAEPGMVYFSSRERGAPATGIYRAEYRLDCP